MYTLDGTVLIQSSCYFVRMIIYVKSRSNSKLGHVASKTMSQDQMVENVLNTSEGTNLFMKVCQNVDPHNI